VNAYKEKAGMV